MFSADSISFRQIARFIFKILKLYKDIHLLGIIMLLSMFNSVNLIFRKGKHKYCTYIIYSSSYSFAHQWSGHLIWKKKYIRERPLIQHQTCRFSYFSASIHNEKRNFYSDAMILFSTMKNGCFFSRVQNLSSCWAVRLVGVA